MTVAAGADDRPYQTDDPVWTDTWAWLATDLDTRTGVLVHCLAKPYVGQTRQSVLVCKDGRTWRRDVLTPDNLQSPLLSIEMDGWAEATLRVADDDTELVATQWDPPMDFGYKDLGPELRSGHIEQGIKVKGRLCGDAFSGAGFRDRGFGPRAAQPLAAHLVAIVAAEEADFFATMTLGHAMQQTLDQEPLVMLGYVYQDGKQRMIERGEVTVLRKHDGAIGGLTIGDIEVTVTDHFGDGTYTAGWDPALPLDAAVARKAYRTWLSFLGGTSRQLGRVSVAFEDARSVF